MFQYMCEMWYRAVVTLLFQETCVLPLQLLQVQHGQPHSVLQTLLHLLLQTMGRLDTETVNICLVDSYNATNKH